MTDKATILFVDDESINRGIYEKIFTDEGYDITTVSCCKDTYSILENNSFDIILIDVMLKNESGFDVLQFVKQNPKHQYTFAVLITSQLTSSDEQAKGLEMGADGYITRPIGKRELIARIEAFMRHKKTITALIKSELQFKKIIDRNPDAMIIVDNEGIIKFANPAAEDLFKVAMDDLLSRTFGYPIVKGEHTEINIVRNLEPEAVAEMRTIDIDWNDISSYLTSIRDISKLKKTQKELEHKLIERSVLMKELNHRTKNNMQLISSILQIKEEYSTDENVKNVLREMNDKIITMSLVHKKLYESSDLSSLNLNAYLQELIYLLNESILTEHSNIDIQYIGEDINVLFDTVIPLGLVINELITNSVKYAFPNKQIGAITITLKTGKSKEIKITYSDNGIGLPKDFNSTTDYKLGLSTINSLIQEQLFGDFSIKGNNGFTCEIFIPEEVYFPRI